MLRLLLLVGLLLLSGCGPTTLVVGVTPGDQRMQATLVESSGKWGAERVAIVDLSGMIMSSSEPGLLSEGENPLSRLAEMLEAARQDEKVKAIILRINSPGGTVTASDAMYREVKRFKERSRKPVVVLMMDVAASGGYYVACAADRIVAYPTTITGSIGVIAQTMTFKPALSSIGIDTETFTSGPNKDIASYLGTMTDSHREILRNLIKDFYGRFVSVVRDARPGIPAGKFAEVTDGRILSGSEALRWGLVDETGDLHTAFSAAKTLANVAEADLMVYHRPLEYAGSVYAKSRIAAGGVQVNLAQLNLDCISSTTEAGIFYVWPGFSR